MGGSLEGFIAKWAASGAAERANKDSFLKELCDVLEVPHPDPTTGDANGDKYVFERDARFTHEGGTTSVGKIDLFKHECFILEAKQGSNAGSKKLGTAKRETPAWNLAMKDAYGQAVGYARAFDKPVPFLVVADLGYCFDLYASFDGSWNYRPFPNAQGSRLFLRDLDKHRDTLRAIFLEPHRLDPSKHAAKVTREIATYIANLAKKLEADKHEPELVATFLMRCLFTMFAEDVGLLPEGAFTNALRNFWIPSPASFAGGIESLWRTMNEGGALFGVVGKILKFNGGLFANPSALPLDEHALRLLLMAAECNWADVEPAIFGTLLERALDPKERHRLGAHYTPRAYVERLVRPTIEEPLRADWDLVQAQVRKLVSDAHEAKKETEKKKKTKEAAALVAEFHQKLAATRVLDPACGSGNFLYVTLDLFKRLEGEVLATLTGLGQTQEFLHLDTVRVTPQQFLGIEVKRWAKEIAELVLWIGYLQWHFRAYGKNLPVPEPVLRDYKNIECRDAVLAYDAQELVRDEQGKPVTRWDGHTMKKSAVTGEDVPDELAQVVLNRYTNPRKAEWPPADFIVGNPPYIGARRIRQSLGDEYVEALRSTYPDLSETIDLVVYWWDRAAKSVLAGATRRFGFITTNSIVQEYSRVTIEQSLTAGVRLVFAISDHPWVESVDGADVRVAMTVGELAPSTSTPASPTAAVVGRVVKETEDGATVELRTVEVINSSLRGGSEIRGLHPLRANENMCFQGVVPAGDGFKLSAEEAAELAPAGSGSCRFVKPYIIGRDVVQRPVDRFIIDFFGLSEADARAKGGRLFQRLIDEVLPERKLNKRAAYRDRWWIFAEPRPALRRAIEGLSRFIATPYTAKFRPFVFVPADTIPDAMVYAIASDDPAVLGVLSSRVHTAWALGAGGRMGVGNDPRYTSNSTFLPFAFPVLSEVQASGIRTAAAALDAHRVERQRQHSDLTLTNIYNVMEKLRSGQELLERDKVVHEQGLVSVLRKLHDDLDALVLEAYGWPIGITDEQIVERLVALNKLRAEEEKRGQVRWLRPELQNPTNDRMTQVALTGAVDDGAEKPAVAKVSAARPSWPKRLAEQIAAVRDLVTTTAVEWSAAEVVAAFKGAKVDDVAEVLDSLTALGLLVSYELVEGRRWRAASAFASVPPPALGTVP